MKLIGKLIHFIHLFVAQGAGCCSQFCHLTLSNSRSLCPSSLKHEMMTITVTCLTRKLQNAFH